MKKLILAAAVMSAFVGSLAHAEEAIPEHTFTGNFTVATDYRFRGISQTDKEPTLQGGFDYAHSSGFYVGNWNSNIDFAKSIEMDFYTGYKWAVTPDLAGDVGVLYYYYPGAKRDGGTDINTTEVYVAGTYKWFTAKYSHTVSDFFGAEDSKGSGYLELNAAFEVADKTTLGLHVGHQKVRHNGDADYTDYKISLAKDFGFATIGLALIDTDLDEAPGARKLAGTAAVLSISKAF